MSNFHLVSLPCPGFWVASSLFVLVSLFSVFSPKTSSLFSCQILAEIVHTQDKGGGHVAQSDQELGRIRRLPLRALITRCSGLTAPSALDPYLSRRRPCQRPWGPGVESNRRRTRASPLHDALGPPRFFRFQRCKYQKREKHTVRLYTDCGLEGERAPFLFFFLISKRTR